MVYNKDHIHHLMNESKMLIFTYNSDQMVYSFENINTKNVTSNEFKSFLHTLKYLKKIMG